MFARGPGSSGMPSAGTSPALPDLSIWQQFQRIGGSLTPEKVSRILRVADTGDTRFLCDLGNEMRQKDGHLHSTLQTREIALASLKWELFYPGETDPKSTRGARQRKFVKEALEGCSDFRRMLAHQTGAVFYGHAVSEILWKLDGGKIVPDEFVNHAPRRFRFRRENGKLCWWDDSMGKPVDFLDEYADKFIVSQPRINGDVECREGLLRCLMWFALFRNWTMSDWLKLAEIAWKPWRLGSYSKKDGGSKEDRKALESILAAMSSSGVAVHPDTVKVELKWPDGGSAVGRSDHAGLYSVAGNEISKAVLGQTLTTEQGAIGSQALGSVHNLIRLDILESDSMWLAEVVQQFIIEPLVRINFGPTAVVPQFRFVTRDGVDLVQFATALEKLAPLFRIPAQWARDEAGIPEPREDEEIVGDDGTIEVDTSGLDTPTPANDPQPPVGDAANKDKKA